MKQTLLISYSILISLLMACSDIETGQPVELEYFYKLYGSFNFEYILSVEETSDGGLFISGFTTEEEWDSKLDDSEALTKPYMCKILPSGMVEWEPEFTDIYNYGMAQDVKVLKKNPGILSIITQAHNTDTTLMHLVRIDNAELTKLTTIKVPAKKIPNAQIVELSNGDIRVVTQVENENSSIELFRLINSDSLSSFHSVALFEENISGRIKVLVDSDDLIVVGGSIKENPTEENGPTDIRLIAIRGKTTFWNTKIGESEVSESCEDVKIIDGKYVVAGNRIKDNSYEILNLTFEPISGNVSDELFFEVDGIDKPICSSFVLNDSNNFAYTGYSEINDTKSDILFIEATRKGEIKKINRFGSNGIENGRNKGKSIHHSKGQNYYFLTGEMEPINNTDICLFKLNLLGEWIDE